MAFPSPCKISEHLTGDITEFCHLQTLFQKTHIASKKDRIIKSETIIPENNWSLKNSMEGLLQRHEGRRTLAGCNQVRGIRKSHAESLCELHMITHFIVWVERKWTVKAGAMWLSCLWWVRHHLNSHPSRGRTNTACQKVLTASFVEKRYYSVFLTWPHIRTKGVPS